MASGLSFGLAIVIANSLFWQSSPTATFSYNPRSLSTPYSSVMGVGALRGGGEGHLFAAAEEVFSDLGVAEGFHVFFAAVDAAAGFVETEYGDGFAGVGGT
jgi:hypothetical protein